MEEVEIVRNIIRNIDIADEDIKIIRHGMNMNYGDDAYQNDQDHHLLEAHRRKAYWMGKLERRVNDEH